MLFQNTIDHINSEISQLLAQVEAKKQQQTQLTELDALTDSTLEGLADVVTKVGHYDRNAIATLKSAVLTLFDSGDNGNDGGNEPTAPTPGPDDDEPELLCLNGLTGECLTTVDDDEELPVDDPTGDKWVLSSEAQLTGQTCAVNPEFFWETTPPDGSSWEFASPLTCLLWEDAPFLGQHCTISPTNNENEGSDLGEATPYVELVQHPESAALAYQRKHDGQIICTYLGFRTKALASSWLRAVEVITSAVELRQAKRLEGFKWELKAKGLSIVQIDRLAAEDLTRTYRQEVTEAVKPPTYREPISKLPVNPDEVEPGDIVTPLLTPGDSYEIIQVMPNGILDCKSLRTGVNMGMRPIAVSLVHKREKPQPAESIEFNDLVQVVADGNDTVGLVGTFGRVKTVKSSRIGVEIDDQLVYFNPDELKVKSKAVAPTHQRSCPPPANVSLSDRDATYLQTSGHYVGLAKQTRQRWEQAGIDPSDLIADMKAKRPAEPLWDAAKYNPVLALVGADDASDF